MKELLNGSEHPVDILKQVVKEWLPQFEIDEDSFTRARRSLEQIGRGGGLMAEYGVPLKQTDHVIYMDGKAHDALVTNIKARGEIDLCYLEVTEYGSVRVVNKYGIPHEEDGKKVPQNPGDPACYRILGFLSTLEEIPADATKKEILRVIQDNAETIKRMLRE